MKPFLALLQKEFRQNYTTIFLLWGITAIAILAVGIKWPSTLQFLPFGELSLFLIIWQIWGVCFSGTVLADFSVSADYRSKAGNFLETIPVSRLAIAASKFVYIFSSLTLVSVGAYALFAFRSKEFHAIASLTDILPIIRLLSLNFTITGITLLIALLGRFRWYVYCGLVIGVFAISGKQDIQLLLTDSLPFSILGFEKSLGEFHIIPWLDLFRNLLIGLTAFLVALGLGLLIRGRNLERVQGSPSCAGCLILFALTCIAITIPVIGLLRDQGIDFEQPNGLRGQASSGRTIVKFHAVTDTAKALPKTDLDEVTQNLETLRTLLKPAWWPSSFLIKSGGPGKREGSTINGNHFVFQCGKSKYDAAKLTRQIVGGYVRETSFDQYHRDNYGWVLNGLSRYAASSPEQLRRLASRHKLTEPVANELKRLGSDALNSWLQVEKIGKRYETDLIGCLLLLEVEDALGEEALAEWLAEIGGVCFVRPDANTLIDWDRGIIFWSGVKKQGAINLLPANIDSKKLLQSAINRMDRSNFTNE